MKNSDEDFWNQEFWFNGLVTHDGGTLGITAWGHGQEFAERLTGIVLIAMMPASGMQETVESLGTLFNFYAQKPRQWLPSPKAESVEVDIAR